MRKFWEKKKKSSIEAIENSESIVVFTFGRTGIGKTTLLLGLYYHLIWSSKYSVNLTGGSKLDLFQQWIIDLEELVLPVPTPKQTIYEVDFEIKTEEEEILLTFLDISGETLRKINLDGTIKFDDSKINEFLENKKIPIIILCLIDYREDYRETANQEILMFNNFVEVLKNYDREFKNVAIVISKSDRCMAQTFSDVEAFVKNRIPPIYKKIKYLTNKTPSCFKFSLGKFEINHQGEEAFMQLNPRCDSLVEWLCEESLSVYEEKGSRIDRIAQSLLESKYLEKTLEKIVHMLIGVR